MTVGAFAGSHPRRGTVHVIWLREIQHCACGTAAAGRGYTRRRANRSGVTGQLDVAEAHTPTLPRPHYSYAAAAAASAAQMHC